MDEDIPTASEVADHPDRCIWGARPRSDLTCANLADSLAILDPHVEMVAVPRAWLTRLAEVTHG